VVLSKKKGGKKMNLTLPIDLPENHYNESVSVAVGCFDGRMRRQFMMFFEIYLRNGAFFPLNFPGGSKLINDRPDLIPIFFSTPIEKCGARRIIILDHEECLAWGGSCIFKDEAEEERIHSEQLRMAKECLIEAYPRKGLDIKLFYAKIIEDKRRKSLLNFIRVR
jgi:hypothetical protein